MASSQDEKSPPQVSVNEPAIAEITSQRQPSPVPSKETPDNLMLSLPPPPPFDLRISNLSIGAPPPKPVLPLPVPIPVPKFLWRALGYAVDETEKNIIRNVSARCGSGEMLAIIGGSGSGKSTLLSAIVGRLANLPVREGELTFVPSGDIPDRDRRILKAREMKDKIGFVPQNDYLLPHLTVRETLSYAAALRLPSSVSSETRTTIVNQTIDELGLKDAADTVIGGAMRKGISGGERRRLSIACILVSLPSCLVLDEPSTGLDSTSAYSLLVTLSQLAKRNRTIVLSIHQPRSDAFALFTRLILLSKGDVVYSGLTSKCLPWFSNLGLDVPHGTNPLDFLIDISSVDLREDSKEEESRARLERLVNAWKEGGHELATEERTALERKLTPDIIDVNEVTAPSTRKHLSEILSCRKKDDSMKPGLWRQTVTLTSRANKNVARDYAQMLGLAFQSIGVGILLGIAFFRLGESPTDIQSLKTLCYQHLPAYFYLSLVYSIFRYCETELVVFDRERSDHLFNVAPWVFAEILSNLPLNFGFPALYAIITYFITNMRTDNLAANLFIFIAECVLVQLGTTAFALLAASLVRVYARASLLANGLSIFLLLTAGYLLLRPPEYVNWVRWISVYYYGFRAIAISQLRDRTFSCEGVVGIARNQCEGNQVLVGLLIPVEHNVGYYFSGLIGVFGAFNAVAGIILAVYKPGGVRHAAQIDSSRGKESLVKSDMDIVRAPVDVEVKGLNFNWVRRAIGPAKRQEKVILNNISFTCPAGQITAILGPSGAGKSSLLQLLAARPLNAGPFAHFETEGNILFDGQPRSRQTSSLVAYIEQEDDYHLPALTVRETLRYAAILRLPATMSRKRKLARAEEVLHMLGLDECANSLVGGPLLKGISGGEKRRLSLAVQMINDPAILIVDEVTSGLDSNMANNVMTALREIALSGRTVILTLHQPRSDIYQALDNVVLLAKGGRTVFAGPRPEVEPTFHIQGFPCPDYFNEADFLLDLVSIDNRPSKEAASRARVEQLVEFWDRYERKFEIRAEKDKTLDAEPTKESRITPMYIALPVVLERMVKNLWRQQPVFWVRLQQTPFLGVLFLLFYQRISRGPSGGQDRIGLIQEIVTPIPFVGLLNCIAIFPADRDLFYHEYRSSAAYSPATFLIAFTLVEIPWQFLSSVLFAVIMNIGAGMRTSPRIFFEFSTVIFGLQTSGESIGIIFACITKSMGLSVSLVSTILTILCQISGLFSLSVPNWLQAIAWGTTMKPAGRVILINEANGLQLNCPPETVQSGECLIQTGQDLIDLFQWKDLSTGKFLGLLMAVAVGYRVAAWLFVVLRIRGW